MQLPFEWNPRNIAIAVAGGFVLLMVILQLILPGIAENKVKDELKDLGSNPKVEVSAFPAVKLIFRKADEVKVTMDEARTTGSADLADELEKTTDADKIDVKVGTFRAGPLTVRDAQMKKDGDTLTASGTVTDRDLRAALPEGLQFAPVRNQDGNGLLLRGTVAVPLIGEVQANVRVQAEEGGITAAPEGLAIADQLFKITVFSDPRVLVSNVSAQTISGGFTLSASGRVQD